MLICLCCMEEGFFFLLFYIIFKIMYSLNYVKIILYHRGGRKPGLPGKKSGHSIYKLDLAILMSLLLSIRPQRSISTLHDSFLINSCYKYMLQVMQLHVYEEF